MVKRRNYYFQCQSSEKCGFQVFRPFYTEDTARSLTKLSICMEKQRILWNSGQPLSEKQMKKQMLMKSQLGVTIWLLTVRRMGTKTHPEGRLIR
jgi:hypothetical protein